MVSNEEIISQIQKLTTPTLNLSKQKLFKYEVEDIKGTIEAINNNKNITYLDLGWNSLGNMHTVKFKIICQMIAQNNNLNKLSLYNNDLHNLSSENKKMLIESLQANTKIRTLIIREREIDEDFAEFIGLLLKRNRLLYHQEIAENREKSVENIIIAAQLMKQEEYFPNHIWAMILYYLTFTKDTRVSREKELGMSMLILIYVFSVPSERKFIPSIGSGDTPMLENAMGTIGFTKEGIDFFKKYKHLPCQIFRPGKQERKEQRKQLLNEKKEEISALVMRL